MANSSSVFRLFDLPPEIRDMIYFHLADISREPLKPDFRTQLLFPAPYVNFNYTYRPPSGLVTSHVALSIYYPTAPPKYSLLPALQSCQKLRSELQRYIKVLQRKSGGGLNPLGYTLDLQSYHSEIFLKWARIQVPPEPPYNIIPEFRINYNVMNLRRKHDNSLRFHSDGRLWDEGLALFNVLNDFFHHGPQGFYIPSINDGDDGGKCSKMVIERLVLNVKLVWSSELIRLYRMIKKSTVEVGPDNLSEAALHDFNAEMKDLECRILKGFAEWMSKFIGVGHLDGIVGKVEILWDDADEWDLPLNLVAEDQENVARIHRMKAEFDLTGTEKRERITEPEGWEKCVWGRKRNFQVRQHGPLWTDRWVELNGVWVPPAELPRDPVPVPVPAQHASANTPDQGLDLLLRLQDEVDEALEHYEGREDSPTAE
ncbi:hypothetical protein TWF106_006262 [Orbilia oligospora]|uniref:Uncharacterized protein n=1 Tax=Orbilia oligospora TaxID=2813651 RepID=A0A7C8V2P3_ORBOL|nr:hypothetical protein TWF679_010155 [Orbilia oligospora]KAF3228743.1 hypothetical protein TWF106_006262 [Orbilia oligospora]